MIPVKQTVFTNPETGKLGNCFVACLASLLELPLRSIPRFYLMRRDQNKRLVHFLTQHGYVTYGWKAGLPKGSGVDGFFIVGLPALDHPPYCHCVIWKEGRIVHDPRDNNTIRLGSVKSHHDIRRLP